MAENVKCDSAAQIVLLELRNRDVKQLIIRIYVSETGNIDNSNMDPNFNCSVCSQAASYYCMCLPEKIYLCDQCASSHFKKGGAHAICPVSAPISNITKLKEYNQNLQLAQKLSGTLDILTSRLSTEHSQLSEALTQSYTVQANELSLAYNQAYADIEAMYQGIQSAIEISKQEIKLWGNTGSVNFSDDTLSFFDVSHPLQNSSFTLIKVDAEVAKRVTLITKKAEPPQQNYLKNFLTSCELQKCECADCDLLRQIAAQKRQSEAPAIIQNAGNLSSAPTNPCWTCVCGYEYNLGPTCQKCHKQNPQISTSQYPEQLLNQSSSGTSYWTCSDCGYGYNMQNCQQCGCVKDGQQKPPDYQKAPAVMQSAGIISQIAPNSTCWACGNCQYAYNIDANCLKCGLTGPPSFQKRNRQASLGVSCAVRSRQPEVSTNPPQLYSSLPQQSSIYPQPDAQALAPPFANQTPGLWTCAACGYAYNRGNKSTCERSSCGKPKPIPESEAQVITWICPNCSQENLELAEACIKCNIKRGWASYLESKGVELNYNKTMWKCKKCGHLVNISEKRCCKAKLKEIEDELRANVQCVSF